MKEVGSEVKVFKSRDFDTCHQKGEWKKGVILKKYSNFYLILIEGAYKECFYESEVYSKDDKNIRSEQ